MKISALRPFASVFFLFLFACQVKSAEIFDHNGSLMLIDYDDGTISYLKVKPSVRKTITEGTVLFSGEIVRRKFAHGTAFTFRRGCPAAAYAVSGKYDSRLPGYILSGAAPHRPRTGCEVLSYEVDNANSRLIFLDKEAQANPNQSIDLDLGAVVHERKNTIPGVPPKPPS